MERPSPTSARGFWTGNKVTQGTNQPATWESLRLLLPSSQLPFAVSATVLLEEPALPGSLYKTRTGKVSNKVTYVTPCDKLNNATFVPIVSVISNCQRSTAVRHREAPRRVPRHQAAVSFIYLYESLSKKCKPDIGGAGDYVKQTLCGLNSLGYAKFINRS